MNEQFLDTFFFFHFDFDNGIIVIIIQIYFIQIEPLKSWLSHHLNKVVVLNFYIRPSIYYYTSIIMLATSLCETSFQKIVYDFSNSHERLFATSKKCYDFFTSL